MCEARRQSLHITIPASFFHAARTHALLAEPADRDARLLAAEDEVRVVLRHGDCASLPVVWYSGVVRDESINASKKEEPTNGRL